MILKKFKGWVLRIILKFYLHSRPFRFKSFIFYISLIKYCKSSLQKIHPPKHDLNLMSS